MKIGEMRSYRVFQIVVAKDRVGKVWKGREHACDVQSGTNTIDSALVLPVLRDQQPQSIALEHYETRSLCNSLPTLRILPKRLPLKREHHQHCASPSDTILLMPRAHKLTCPYVRTPSRHAVRRPVLQGKIGHLLQAVEPVKCCPLLTDVRPLFTGQRSRRYAGVPG